MDSEYKEVRFDIYCETCKHKNVEEYKDPCNECLDTPCNLESIKPILYKPKEKRG